MLAKLRLAHQPLPDDVPLRSIVECINVSGDLVGFLEKCGHPNLQTLSLAACTLDAMAGDNLAKVLSLPSLTSVTLAHIKGVSIDQILLCVTDKCTFLDLSGTPVNTLKVVCDRLPTLTTLNLSYWPEVPLSNVPLPLCDLCLDGCGQLLDIPALKRCTMLSSLGLDGVRLSSEERRALVNAFGILPNLKRVRLNLGRRLPQERALWPDDMDMLPGVNFY